MKHETLKEKYIEDFFGILEIYDDKDKKKNQEIKNKLIEFLREQSEEKAFEIYVLFFETYWIGIQEIKNPFVELITKMKNYEISSSGIIDNQRDHFVHSVNVFILGLIFYCNSEKMQNQFIEYIKNSDYKNYYSTKNEEFFYRWGISSLSHDLAYPIEITLRQLRAYSEFLDSYSINNDNFKIVLNFKNFKNFDSLSTLEISEQYKKEFLERNPNLNLEEYTSCMDIMANEISKTLNVDKNLLIKDLKNKVSIMESGEYIDHGFYSSMIVLKWYHTLINKTKWDPSYFVYPIVDSAVAILNHNYFCRTLLKEPFNITKLSYSSSPISFMLILCDELQEWNRRNYATNDISVSDFEISFDDSNCYLKYFSDDADLVKKEDKIKSTLLLEEMFEIKIEVEGVKND